MKRLLLWFSPALVLVLGAAYAFAPHFSLGTDQVCEMLTTGNARGLMMVFHSAGPASIAVALGVGCLAFLVPLFKPEYLLKANMATFGHTSGILLTVFGALLALTVLFLLGHSLWSLIPEKFRNRFTRLSRFRNALLVGLSVWMLVRVL